MTDRVERADRTLHCLDGGAEFVFPITEERFFADQGWPPPIRCPACRQLARVRRDAAAPVAKSA